VSKIKVPLFRPSFSQEDVEAIASVLDSGYLTTGARCQEFETMFAERLGAKHAVSINSCTGALHLALASADVGPGDIVFTPTMGFATDIQVIQWQGATPVLVDCDNETLCMDPAALKGTIEAIRRGSPGAPDGQLRAVIVIDYAGQMADYTALHEICREFDMLLIEDAAHALPAYWRAGPDDSWQGPGHVADFACFSFYANKTMTTGEGGMVVTDNPEHAAKIRSMRIHGLELWSDEPAMAWTRQVTGPGYKWNMPDLAAALGIRQLLSLDELWDGRRRMAKGYTERLSDCKFLRLPREIPDRRHSWHLYVVRLAGAPDEELRDTVIRTLYERGVQTSVHWYPLHQHEYFRDVFRYPSTLSVAESAYQSMFSMPIFPSMTPDELVFVVETLLGVLDSIGFAGSATEAGTEALRAAEGT